MKKVNSNFMQKNWIKWGVLPLILLIVWVGVSLYQNLSTTEVTIIGYYYSTKETSSWKKTEIYKGEKISTQFVAKDDRMGIVSVRFDTFSKINDDTLIFRIKERGQNNWYYENVYKVDQFQDDQFFTFGFPIIENSLGKEYIVELESQYGTPGNAVAVSSIEPDLFVKHQYQKERLASDKSYLLSSLINKIKVSFVDREFLVSSIIYLLPLLLYILWQFYKEFFLQRFYFVLVPMALILIQSIWLQHKNEIIILGTLWLVTIVIYVYKLSSRVTFLLALVPLALSLVTSLIGQPNMLENFTMWTYLLLCVGIIQQLTEYKRGNKKHVDYDVFIRKLLHATYPSSRTKR